MLQENMSIQWFPGHMAKTRRLIQANLKLVDAVVELRDARIPYSSSNPEIKRLCGNKPRILLLAKCDLASEQATKKWCEYYKAKDIPAIAVDCKSGKNIKDLEPLIKSTISELIARRKAKGIVGDLIRIMVVGIPNVGKSSLINRLAGSKRTKVADKPGVTRGKQWIRAGSLEILDMPGVLWPKFEDPAVGERLAFTGAVKDDILDIETLASRLLNILAESYFELLCKRYSLTQDDKDLPGHELLNLIAQKRGMLLPGGDTNTERAAIMLLDEFRAGKIGKITLEMP